MEKPKKYIASCSFGKDSLATILLALQYDEPLDCVVFSEVMFDHKRGISGEIPEHIEWIYGTAIPKLEALGLKVDVVRSKVDYVTLCRKVLKEGKKAGLMYGLQSCKPCYANSDCKLAPIRKYYNSFKKEYDIVQYVGIAADEHTRLKRLEGTNKISLLAKYGYTEDMALRLCKDKNLLSPIYSMGYRGGCFFCFNANIDRYIHIRKHYPERWAALCQLYYETNTKFFKYNKSLEDIEREMDIKEDFDRRQLSLF